MGREGDVLLVVFSTIFVLIAVVGALHYSQGMSRAVTLHGLGHGGFFVEDSGGIPSSSPSRSPQW